MTPLSYLTTHGLRPCFHHGQIVAHGPLSPAEARLLAREQEILKAELAAQLETAMDAAVVAWGQRYGGQNFSNQAARDWQAIEEAAASGDVARLAAIRRRLAGVAPDANQGEQGRG